MVGCGFGSWWVCGGWGVLSRGGAVVVWGYGFCLVVVCVCLFVCFFFFPLGGGMVFVAGV